MNTKKRIGYLLGIGHILICATAYGQGQPTNDHADPSDETVQEGDKEAVPSTGTIETKDNDDQSAASESSALPEGTASDEPKQGEAPSVENQSATTWYVLKDGQKRGPFSKAELERQIKSGELETHVAVSEGETDNWVVAADAFPEATAAYNARFQSKPQKKNDDESKASDQSDSGNTQSSSGSSTGNEDTVNELVWQGYRMPSFVLSIAGGFGVMGHSIDSGKYDPQFKKDFKNQYSVFNYALSVTPRYYFKYTSKRTSGVGFGLGYGYFDDIHTINCEMNFLKISGKNSFRYTFVIPINMDFKATSISDEDADYENASGKDVDYSPLGIDIGFGVDFAYERLLRKWISAGVGIKGTVVTTSISTSSTSSSSSGYYTTTTVSVNEENQRHWFPGLMIYGAISFRAPRKHFRE